MPGNRQREGLGAAVRSIVPARPGVYTFRDDRGETIYIGKAVDLRRRMLSYFRPAGGLEPRTAQMVFSIRSFDFRETETELLALLLEDCLVKRERPRFNVRQLEFEEYKYLVVTDDPYPACLVVSGSEAARGTLFGPLRDRFLGERVLDILQRQFMLRSCRDRQPFRRSANFDLGLCTGPCRNVISLDDYAAVSGRVIAFLNGDESWVKEKLSREMWNRAEAFDYEEASALKEIAAFCHRFCKRQRFFQRFASGRVVVKERGNTPISFDFRAGALSKVVREDGPAGRELDVPGEVLEPLTDRRWVLDRANIVYGWLRRRQDPARPSG